MSFKSWVSSAGSKLGNFFRGVGVFLGGLFADGLSRGLGFWEFITVPLGWKHLRHLDLRVVILRDQVGPIGGLTHNDVHWTIVKTKKIFLDQAEVAVHDAYGIGIVTVDDPSPSYALNFEGGTISGDIGGNFGQVGDYFRGQSAEKFWSFLNPPITVFVVNRIEKGMNGGVLDTAKGVTVPYFANYALVEAAQFLPPDSPSTTPAHEMGHLCGLLGPHSNDPENLMSKGTDGEKLKSWQVAIVRSSKYVSFINY